MSTKNLRSVLQLMREDKYPALYAAAKAEVEAIERAAKYAAHSPIPGKEEDAKQYMDTMLSIADNAT
jgi:hypothetical protein